MHKIVLKQGCVSVRVDYIEGRDIVSAVYQCACGRCQKAEHPEFVGGISKQSAENHGWILTGDNWKCPFCSSNEDKLKDIFNAPPPSFH